ncbi:MAG: lamin tail domain-containing protein, partial [Planctomycetota bacterium]
DDTGQVPELGSIRINELLAHSHGGTADWAELHNTTDAIINISGWFLSDNDGDLMKYEIGEGTTIDANGYIVFYEDLHFGNLSDPGCHSPFALSENGETLYLHSGQNGMLTGYSEQEKFGASETDVAFGRYRKSTGTFNFVAMSENTPGLQNAYPKVGPIVISEIMYHPQVNRDAEYVELLNISGAPVTLYDFDVSEPWKFTDDPEDPGVELFFPGSPVTMNANERILLVKNLAAFNSEFSAPPGTRIFEWGDGKLDNAGEKVQLSMPGDVDGYGTRCYIRVDRVNYSDGSHPVGEDPWPTEPDGTGKSLARRIASDYGNDVINWKADDPTPGSESP